MPSKGRVEKFLVELLQWYAENRRDLPWRPPRLAARKDGSIDPYRVLLSEVMLQQTQVARVEEKYHAFLCVYPNVRALARANQAGVLRQWQGLGYNRRALYLHKAARAVVEQHRGVIPRSEQELRALPGVGSYTAGALLAFAYNTPSVFVETNIRTVLFHTFLKEHEAVSDRALEEFLNRLLDAALSSGWSTREFYYALMDYGAHLKASGVRVNKKSAHYKVQQPFKGSNREIRGAIVRVLTKAPHARTALLREVAKETNREKAEIALQIEALLREGVIHESRAKYLL